MRLGVDVVNERFQLDVLQTYSVPRPNRRISITTGGQQLIQRVIAIAWRIVPIELIIGLSGIATCFKIIIDLDEFLGVLIVTLVLALVKMLLIKRIIWKLAECLEEIHEYFDVDLLIQASIELRQAFLLLINSIYCTRVNCLELGKFLSHAASVRGLVEVWMIREHLLELEIDFLCRLGLIHCVALYDELAPLLDGHRIWTLLHQKGKEPNNYLRESKIIKLYASNIVAVDRLPLQILLFYQKVRIQLEVHLLVNEWLDFGRDDSIAKHVLVLVVVIIVITALFALGLIGVFVVQLIVSILLLKIKYISKKRLDLFIRFLFLYRFFCSLGLLNILQNYFVF